MIFSTFVCFMGQNENKMANETAEIDVIDDRRITFDYVEFMWKNESKFQRRHTTNLNYNDFFVDFMRVNKPIIITGIADQWECMDWIHQKTVNFTRLRECIDTAAVVPVADCNKISFNAHQKIEMTFGEFLDYWEMRINDRNSCDDEHLYYLKDWHLQRYMPNYQFYTTPVYFSSDWLNEFCVQNDGDDYRFVYMGPKGTWTPFHSDVFSSFSWSTNIIGVKRWLFFAPGEELKLCDSLGNLPFKLDEATIERSQAVCIEVIQNAGETIFVPSGWYHQVYNLDDTISVNHNWFNGCNVYAIWTALKRCYDDVLNEISHCRDMVDFDGHCQLMLRSVFGLNFKTFLDILCCIAENRNDLLNTQNVDCLNDLRIGKRHAIFDLEAIIAVLNEFRQIEYDAKPAQTIVDLIGNLENAICDNDNNNNK